MRENSEVIGDKGMSTTIEKLNERILQQYVVTIMSESLTFEYNRGIGEGKRVSKQTNMSKNFKTDQETIFTYLMDFIEEYIELILFMDFDKETLHNAIFASEDEYTFWLFSYVDSNDVKPTKKQIEKWENGEEQLFIQKYGITIKINGVWINNSLIHDLLFPVDQN